jgi:D-amino-acid dehydrogenase
MKIMVIGAGIVGATTAWMLSEAGFDVTLLERQAGPCLETSKANACLLSAGHATVWNQPSAPFEFLQGLFKTDPIVAAQFLSNPGFMPWLVRFLGNCGHQTSNRKTLLNSQLAMRSVELTRRIIEKEKLNVSMQAGGVLYCYDTKKQLKAEEKHAKYINKLGMKARILTAQQLLELEPALRYSKRSLLGALLVYDDISADGHAFAKQLLDELSTRKNVQIINNTWVKEICHKSSSITSIKSEKETLQADHYVMCLGPESGLMLQKLGLTLPIVPAKGYSLTVAVKSKNNMPGYGISDKTESVAITPLTDHLRITSYAQFVGFDKRWKDNNFARHRRVTEALYPNLVDWSCNQHEWAGLRPMTPDGNPVIGRAKPYKNLWLNTGHGYLGWTQAAASAEILVNKLKGDKESEFSRAFELRW